VRRGIRKTGDISQIVAFCVSGFASQVFEGTPEDLVYVNSAHYLQELKNIQRKIANITNQQLQYVFRNIFRRSATIFKVSQRLVAGL
jgi:hypothetical protein